MRIHTGLGFDSHRFVSGRPLVLGGVVIPHSEGLLGHSDADVLLHAVIDALFGAIGDGDIGRHFPDTAPAYEGVSSLLLLRKTMETVRSAGWSVCNVDATLLAEAPKLAPHMPAIRASVASALGIPEADVSVKAKTLEKMGSLGRREGIGALCSVLVLSNE